MEYNPEVMVRLPLAPNAPTKFLYLVVKLEELFFENPWLKDYQEEMVSALKQYSSYYPEEFDLKISIA